MFCLTWVSNVTLVRFLEHYGGRSLGMRDSDKEICVETSGSNDRESLGQGECTKLFGIVRRASYGTYSPSSHFSTMTWNGSRTPVSHSVVGWLYISRFPREASPGLTFFQAKIAIVPSIRQDLLLLAISKKSRASSHPGL